MITLLLHSRRPAPRGNHTERESRLVHFQEAGPTAETAGAEDRNERTAESQARGKANLSPSAEFRHSIEDERLRNISPDREKTGEEKSFNQRLHESALATLNKAISLCDGSLRGLQRLQSQTFSRLAALSGIEKPDAEQALWNRVSSEGKEEFFRTGRIGNAEFRTLLANYPQMSGEERKMLLRLPIIDPAALPHVRELTSMSQSQFESMTVEQQRDFLLQVGTPEQQPVEEKSSGESLRWRIEVPDELKPYLSVEYQDGFPIGLRFGNHSDNLTRYFDGEISPQALGAFNRRRGMEQQLPDTTCALADISSKEIGIGNYEVLISGCMKSDRNASRGGLLLHLDVFDPQRGFAFIQYEDEARQRFNSAAAETAFKESGNLRAHTQ